VVAPWEESRVDKAEYRLSVGSECFTNGIEGGSVKRLGPGEDFQVAPGQFIFVLTSESVAIPENCIGFISARARIKFRGLVNVSGFQVNPGYTGNLIFAMFNAGPSYVHLKEGEDIFSLWISELLDLKSGEVQKERKPGYNSIPTDIINGLSGRALTAYQLSESIKSLREDEISTLREELSKIKDRLVYLSTGLAVLIGLAFLVLGPPATMVVKDFIASISGQ
jgi:dCTP deaminase